ncbi:MAG: ribonuclease III [Burkholderiaceae bacterium]|jgi:ribonuclease-3|nr:ribonuclease III [Burkholderiaceae bacterium]
MNELLADLQQRLHYRFQDARLLARALTHRSFSASHNERLEFLGDAVLNLAVAHRAFEALQGYPEGDLSRVRAQLVREESLHGLALRLGLPEALQLGEGERRAGGRERASILADALEAIIGAVYLDGGYPAAQALVGRLLEGVAITPSLAAAAKDAKTALQEWLQARRMALPRYEVVAITGAEHQQTFDVRCTVEALGRRSHAQGQGTSRRAAEQTAAATMLTQLTESVL